RRIGARRLPPARAPSRLWPDQEGRRGLVRPPAEDARQLALARRHRVAAGGRGGAARPRARPGDARRGARSAPVRRAGTDARMKRAPAHRKITLALLVGPARPDAYHEVATVLQRIALADDIALEPADDLRVTGFPDDTLVTRALEELSRAEDGGRAWSV